MPEKVDFGKNNKAVKMKRWPLTAEDIQNLIIKGNRTSERCGSG